MEPVGAEVSQSSARNGYARQTTEAKLPPFQREAFPGFRGQQSMALSPRGFRNADPGEVASEQAPDSGIAFGPQAVSAPLGTKCDAAVLQQRGGQTIRGSEHFWEPGGGWCTGCTILRSGHSSSEAHSARPSSLCLKDTLLWGGRADRFQGKVLPALGNSLRGAL